MQTLFLALVIAQPAALEPPMAQPLPDTYAAAYAQAVKEKKPLVLFVACPPRVVPGCVDFWMAELNGSAKPRIVVVRLPLNDAWNNRTLPANATNAEIRGLEVSRGASPFLRPGEVPIADADDDDADSLPAFLRDLVPYTTAKNTQTTFRRLRGYIAPSPRASLELKWRVPGHLAGVHGWSSRLFKSRDSMPTVGLVRQDSNDDSSAITWGRNYPDGSTFADVLRNEQGKVFEIRVASKQAGQWERFVAFSDASARPHGYVRPTSKQCAGCHDQAGVSAYGGAAIPGADTVISDPFDVLERGESVQGGNGLSLR